MLAEIHFSHQDILFMGENNEILNQYDYFEDEYFDKALKTYSDAIGKFFMEFSALEHELDITIAEIIHGGTHNLGYQILVRMNLRTKIDLFYRLYNSLENTKDKKETAKLKVVRDSINSIVEFRNLLAHANWKTIQKGGIVRTRFSSDESTGTIKFKNYIIKPKDIRARTREANKLVNILFYYKEKVLQF